MSTQPIDASPKATERGISRVVTLPPPSPGFIGEGHQAIFAIEAGDFAQNDPFILLADDRLDLPPGAPAGAAHPHAGFEIATFIVEGEMRDRDEGLLRTGDIAWTTAGSGVIHSEDVEPLGMVRILQLWMTTPSESRWVEPRFTHVTRGQVAVRREPGVDVHVYSGASGDLRVEPHTYLPLTMLDIRLSPNATFDQSLPSSYSGFLYPLEGDVTTAGATPQRLAVGQLGVLESVGGTMATNVRLSAGNSGARVVLYAGERQNVPIVTHGPFVGETRADLQRVSWAYTQGRLPRLSEIQRRS